MNIPCLNLSSCKTNFLEASCSKKLVITGCALATIASLGLLALSLGGLLPFYASYIALPCGIISTIALFPLLAYKQKEKEPAKEKSQKVSHATRKSSPPPKRKPEEYLFSFYCEEGKDIGGRTFEEILGWNDGRLESQHDYIQWLFPLFSPSQFNSTAPVLTKKLLDSLKASDCAKKRVSNAFQRMLRFYGLQYNAVTKKVERGANWQERKKNWLTPNNHNHLRITRILKFLSLMEMHEKKKAFFDQLTFIKSEEGAISEKTYSLWKEV